MYKLSLPIESIGEVSLYKSHLLGFRFNEELLLVLENLFACNKKPGARINVQFKDFALAD